MDERNSSTCSNYSQETCTSIASFLSQWSVESVRIAKCLSRLSNFSPDLENYMSVKAATGSELIKVHSGFFLDSSMWLSGAKKKWWIMKKNVFLNVSVPNYSTLNKLEHYGADAELETILTSLGNDIVFAKKTGHEIYSMNLDKETPVCRYKNTDMNIAAICSSTDHTLILDHNSPKFIRVLDTNFHQVGTVDSHLKRNEIQECTLDVCIKRSPRTQEKMNALDYTIIISCSKPQSLVKIVSKTKGVLWQLDRSRNMFPDDFNPCSVSYSKQAGILVADREEDRVSQQSIILAQKFTWELFSDD